MRGAIGVVVIALLLLPLTYCISGVRQELAGIREELARLRKMVP